MKQTISPQKPKYHHQKANVTLYDQLEDDGYYYQLVEGVLEVAASPIPFHQEVSFKLTDRLNTFLKTHPIGKLYYAPLDVEMDDQNIYQPDLLFISNDRLSIITEKRVVGSPDLVIEILSPNTRNLDLTAKYRVYEEKGVLEYWIVDPEKKTFRFYQLTHDKFQEVAVQNVYSSEVLKPFTLQPSDFWQI
ncbi:MAG TPA: Uma2 family endonuclease [Spirochaetes bacterium]|nr:Uma2 family endonuclease [Spirochaetota bacterium]